ncbi:hypothetical protein D3C78_789680 [compost metagenome]
MVKRTVAVMRGDDAERDGDGKHEDDRDQNQFDGRGNSLRQISGDGALGNQRETEIAVQGVADVIEILGGERPVETHLTTQRIHLFLRRRRAERHTGWITRHHASENENHDGQGDHDQHESAEPVQNRDQRMLLHRWNVPCASVA